MDGDANSAGVGRVADDNSEHHVKRTGCDLTPPGIIVVGDRVGHFLQKRIPRVRRPDGRHTLPIKAVLVSGHCRSVEHSVRQEQRGRV